MRALIGRSSRKDLRLLWRDRAGLIFLTIAPMMVITVAGFSLANLYGADPTGQTAYDFPSSTRTAARLAQRSASASGARTEAVHASSRVAEPRRGRARWCATSAPARRW